MNERTASMYISGPRKARWEVGGCDQTSRQPSGLTGGASLLAQPQACILGTNTGRRNVADATLGTSRDACATKTRATLTARNHGCQSQGLPIGRRWFIMPFVSHSVLFRKFPLDQIDATADVVARVCGIPAYDARTKIHHGWGFLDRNLPPETAQQIGEALGGEGVAAMALPNSELVDPPVPEVMLGFQPEADGFVPQLQDPRIQPHHVPWSDVSILAAGGFTEEIVRRDTTSSGKSGKAQLIGIGVFLVTGIPMGLFGGKKKKEARPVKTNRLITFAQLITAQGESYFMDPEHFDFSGLGPRKQVNASLNFRTFVSEFARLNPGPAQPRCAPRPRKQIHHVGQLPIPERFRDRTALAGEHLRREMTGRPANSVIR